MKFRKLAAALLFCALSAAAAFAAKPFEGKKFHLAINATFAPFELAKVDPATGNSVITGFDIDVLDHIAGKLGFAYELEDMSFSGLIGALQSGRADFVISGLSNTPARREVVDFSNPYFFCKTAIIAPAGSSLKHTADLKGKKVAAVFGTEYCKVALAAGADVTQLENSAMVTQELVNGRVDAAIMDGAQCSVKVKDHPGFEYFVLPDSELSSSASRAYSIAFQKGSPLIPYVNDVIKEMQSDGTMKKLLVKWMGEEFAY